MRYFLTLIVLIGSWTACWAQPAPKKDPAIKRVRLVPGQAAPFHGNLLSDAAIAELISRIDETERLVRLETVRCARELDAYQESARVTCQAKITIAQSKVDICQRQIKRQREIYESLLKKCQRPPPWYKSPVLAYFAGSVITGGVCAAAMTAR